MGTREYLSRMGSRQRLIRAPRRGLSIYIQKSVRLWPLLAAVVVGLPLLPGDFAPIVASAVVYVALTLAVAWFCFFRGRGGVVRYRLGWQAMAVAVALNSVAMLRGLLDGSASAAGPTAAYGSFQLHGIIIAAYVLGILFLEGSAETDTPRSTHRNLDLVLATLGLVWVFVHALPALAQGRTGAAGYPLLVAPTGLGAAAFLSLVIRRGGVKEYAGAWLWLRLGIAGQALHAAFGLPFDGAMMTALGPIDWVSGVLHVGALTCIGVAAREPRPTENYNRQIKPWDGGPLAPWIASGGVVALLIAHLAGIGDYQISTAVVICAVASFILLMPWRLQVSHRRSSRQSLVLRQESVRLRHLLDSITDAVVTEDLQGKIVFANAAFHRLFGMRPGRGPLPRADALVHEDDVGLREKHLRSCLEDRRPAPRFEYRGLRSDGVTLELEAYVQPLEFGGIVAGVTSVIRDLARQRLIEKSQRAMSQRLEFFVNEMPLGCIIWDLNFAVQEWNQSAEQIFGWSHSDVMQRPYKNFLACDEDIPAVEDLWRDLRQGHAVHRHQWRNQTKDKGVIDCEWFYTAMLDDTGRVVAVASMVHDLTDRKNLERQLLQSQKLEAIGTLAGGIAHDFNNLLTTILGHTSLALMKLGPDHSASRGLRDAQSAAERGADLVKQLLRFGRRHPSQVEVVSLNDSVTSVVRLLRPGIDSRIRIDTDLTPGLWPVEGDPSQLEQALMNLVINARDAIEGSGRITIRSRNRSRSTDSAVASSGNQEEVVELQVIDDGCGMDLDVQQRIFDPFFTTKSVGQGTGLGLAMVFSIVQSHAGRVEVQSKPGKGSEFRIAIPRTTRATPPRPLEVDSSPAEKGRETILFVDDEESLRMLGRQVLQEQGYAVVEACDGEEAVEIFRGTHEKIDLVLLDLTMPRKSGWAAFEEIREVSADVPVILSSGYSTQGGGNTANRRGANAFLPKPYKAQQLAQAVRTVLNAQQDESAVDADPSALGVELESPVASKQ